MREIPVGLFVACSLLVVGWFCAGILLGMHFVKTSTENSLSLLTRLQRTGTVEAPAPIDDAVTVRGSSVEGAAMMRVMKDAIEKGADQLQAAAVADGIHLSRKQALADAAAMLQEPGAAGGAS